MSRSGHTCHMVPMPAGHQLEAIHWHGNLPIVKDVPIPERTQLAIFCHPWSFLGGRAQDPVLREVVGPFCRHGFSVILLNSRGVGGSTGRASFTGLPEAEDLNEVVGWLMKNQFPALEELVLLGYSHGCIPISHIKPLPAPLKTRYVLLSYPLTVLPFITLFNHKTHAAALNSLVKELADTVSSSSSPIPSPLLVLYGDHDQFTGIARYEAWVKSLQELGNIPSGNTVIADAKVAGGDHFWQDMALDHMLIEVDKWTGAVARTEPNSH